MKIGSLAPGDRVRIVSDFKDFDGALWAAGTEFVVVSREYFPYDGGYTLRLEGGHMMRLAEVSPENALVLGDEGDAYWMIVRDPG